MKTKEITGIHPADIAASAQLGRLLFIGLFAASMSACTTTEAMKWGSVGGSKADGTVILGIDVPPKMGVRETIVQWDVQQANAEANRRCQNWGYANAEAFNDDFPIQKTCHPQGISPCWSKTYRITYQCVGSLRETPLTPDRNIPSVRPSQNRGQVNL